MDRTRGYEFHGYRLVEGVTGAGVPKCEVRKNGNIVRVFHGRHARADAKEWILNRPKKQEGGGEEAYVDG